MGRSNYPIATDPAMTISELSILRRTEVECVLRVAKEDKIISSAVTFGHGDGEGRLRHPYRLRQAPSTTRGQ
jgi:hypothetical protein